MRFVRDPRRAALATEGGAFIQVQVTEAPKPPPKDPAMQVQVVDPFWLWLLVGHAVHVACALPL